MIINAAHDFAFVHIPKCAGSTIRQQLRDLDDLGGQFYRNFDHPGLGPINGNHVPLPVLRDHFPDAFAGLQKVTSYAITREPLDRFISGISQLIRDRGSEPGQMDDAGLRASAEGAIAHLRARDRGFPDRAHILFARQTDYVMLEGQRIVTRIENDHDLPMIRDQVWNPTVSYRYPALTRPLKRMKDMGQKVLPLKTYVLARSIGMRLFTSSGVPKLDEVLRNMPGIKDFVAEYYAADFELHTAARAETELVAAG